MMRLVAAAALLACARAQHSGRPSGFTYIGCFVDAGERDLAVDGGQIDVAEDDSAQGSPARVMACATLCAGYQYMGLQWDNECFCDNDYGDQGERDISSCDSDSSVGDFPDYADLAGVGNSARAGWTNAVYDVLYMQADGSSAGR